MEEQQQQAVGGQCPVARVVQVAALGPVLEGVGQHPNSRVDRCVHLEQLGVPQCLEAAAVGEQQQNDQRARAGPEEEGPGVP